MSCGRLTNVRFLGVGTIIHIASPLFGSAEPAKLMEVRSDIEKCVVQRLTDNINDRAPWKAR